MSIDFVYVGQGNACFIRTASGKSILIDTGEGGGFKYEHGLKTFMPYVLYKGYKDIDEIYITHLDSDHSGGAYYIVKYLNVSRVYIPDIWDDTEEYFKLNEICKKRGVELTKISMGFKKEIEGGLSLRVFWPDKNNLIEKNVRNNNSLVIVLNIYGRKIIFPGDIQKEAERKIVNKYIKSKKTRSLLKSDILLSPHHGSKTSSSEEFLNLVDPKYIVISSGKDNLFGHPNIDILARYKKKGRIVFRTDINGIIRFNVFKNGNIKYHLFR